MKRPRTGIVWDSGRMKSTLSSILRIKNLSADLTLLSFTRSQKNLLSLSNTSTLNKRKGMFTIDLGLLVSIINTHSNLLDNFAKSNQEQDELWIICLDNPNDIVLSCTHSYCNEWILEWKQFHRSCPLWRHSVTSEGNPVPIEDKLSNSSKYELVDIPKDSKQEGEMDKIMKSKLISCLEFLEKASNE